MMVVVWYGLRLPLASPPDNDSGKKLKFDKWFTSSPDLILIKMQWDVLKQVIHVQNLSGVAEFK